MKSSTGLPAVRNPVTQCILVWRFPSRKGGWANGWQLSPRGIFAIEVRSSDTRMINWLVYLTIFETASGLSSTNVTYSQQLFSMCPLVRQSTHHNQSRIFIKQITCSISFPRATLYPPFPNKYAIKARYHIVPPHHGPLFAPPKSILLLLSIFPWWSTGIPPMP